MPRPSFVLERERLMNRLLEWEDRKLILIHAQAGQGKSTLAAAYARAGSSAVVWYNLDQEDDNPDLFLAGLAEAVAAVRPGGALHLPPVPRDRYGLGGMRRGIDRWIGQVFDGIAGPVLVVFDDYDNAADSAAFRKLLALLLTCTHASVRFLIISRVQPELEIARLRATQSVGELTGTDLRFSNAEVQELFTIVFRMQISPSEASLINATAEGWPAGLILMREYLSALPPSARAIAITDRRESGFRTHVFDYLAQEVFAHLPRDMQRFLLRTSIVDYLSASLMEILTGLPQRSSQKPSVASMVADLRKKNLFVHAMDDDASLIRYHALFREFLRKKLLSQTRPAEIKSLYTAASSHFKKSGDRIRAVDLLLASGQFLRAVDQIEACGEDLIARGGTRTLIRWIEALPLEYGNRPWFLLYRAASCRFADPRTALSFFELALKGFRSDTDSRRRNAGLMLSLAGMIEACFYAGGNFRRMSRAAATAGALLRRTGRWEAGARARLLLALGTACFFTGRLREGAKALREALEVFHRIRDYYYQIQSAIYLAPCSIYLGDFRLARDAVRRGFDAHSSIPEESGGEAALCMARAMTALFEGDFSEARENIGRCQALAQEYELEAFDFLSLDIGGWLRIATEDYENAESLLRECKDKGAELGNDFFNASAAHLLAVNYLHQGRLDKARAEADHALAVRSRSGSRLFHAVSLSASGALELKRGSLARAERELRESLAIFRHNGARQQEANVLLLLAGLSGRKGRREEMQRLLEDGFRIGEEQGFSYYYLFTRAELAERARQAANGGVCVDYCRSLLSRHAAGNGEPFIGIRCLGGFEVIRGGARVSDGEWKSQRARALIKLLASKDTLSLSRDTAIEVLWQEWPREPQKALNSMISRIRRVLYVPGSDGSCILQKDGLILLDCSRVWTDVGQFQSALGEARRLHTAGRAEAALREFEKATMLYRGDFLPGDLSADWTAPVRDHLRLQYLKALAKGAEITEKTGCPDLALSWYEMLFSADPCSEPACRWLMVRYRSEGRRSEAIRTYDQCERALSRELDLEPEDETRAIYRGIIGG